MLRKNSIIIASLVSALPASVFIFINFFFYRRGWQADEMERWALYWAVLTALSPMLALLQLHIFGKAIKVARLFLFLALSFAVYCLLHWVLCFLVWISAAKDFDGRYFNLFNTIRQESLFVNLVVFSITVLIISAWQYLYNKEASSKDIEKLRSTLTDLETNHPPQTEKLKNIAIRQGHKHIILPVEEIYFLKSDGPYIKITTAKDSYLLTGRLYDICDKLPKAFLRVHRSQAINSSFVKEVRSLLNGDYTIVMRDDTELRGSRTYRGNIRSLI